MKPNFAYRVYTFRLGKNRFETNLAFYKYSKQEIFSVTKKTKYNIFLPIFRSKNKWLRLPCSTPEAGSWTRRAERLESAVSHTQSAAVRNQQHPPKRRRFDKGRRFIKIIRVQFGNKLYTTN